MIHLVFNAEDKSQTFELVNDRCSYLDYGNNYMFVNLLDCFENGFERFVEELECCKNIYLKNTCYDTKYVNTIIYFLTKMVFYNCSYSLEGDIDFNKIDTELLKDLYKADGYIHRFDW